jgi:hypothetical protein
LTGDSRDWALASGQPPSRNEFAAVVAACQDRAATARANVPLETCLGEFGLRRAP